MNSGAAKLQAWFLAILHMSCVNLDKLLNLSVLQYNTDNSALIYMRYLEQGLTHSKLYESVIFR